ncbi:MAG: endonuclease/exonuclease/phosphatase family metal-dependent hydrolase [Parasphingorhabdus sp.]
MIYFGLLFNKEKIAFQLIDTNVWRLKPMKLVTYNIRYGIGLDTDYSLKRIAHAVQDADIIALQEVERHWRRTNMDAQPEQLAALLPDKYWAYCPSFDVDASEIKQDGTVVNRRRQFGTMLLSRWPILSIRRIVFPQLNTPNLFNMATGALECVVQSPVGRLQVYSLHLSSLSVRERLIQIDKLLELRDQLRITGGVWNQPSGYIDPTEAENFQIQDWNNGEEPPQAPEHTVVMGDFNSIEESEEYIRLAGKLDPVYGRGMHSDDLVDTWFAAKNDKQTAFTWWPDPPDRVPGFPLRLDYCFVSSELSKRVCNAWVDVDATGSDHKPYWVELADYATSN